MKKQPALIATLVTTIVVGVFLLGIGLNALFNPSTVVAAQAPAAASSTTDPSATGQVQQLQNLIAQYQARDQQYQQQLNTLKQQLNDTNTSLQQYQMILSQLQQIGVIQIQNGQIYVNRGGGGSGGGFFDGD